MEPSYSLKHKAMKDIIPMVMQETNKSKALGQYMTPPHVARFMVSLITKPKSAKILEPGAGTGVFLKILKEKGFNNIVAYEIDKRFKPFLDKVGVKVFYKDFLEVDPVEQFDVVIGNPPYVRWRNIPLEWRKKFKQSTYWKKVINGLCDLTYAFIYHSVNLLKPSGELIFICPIFWLETLHGRRLRSHLAKNGSLEIVINLNESRVFEEVSSTIIIFKYIKGKKLPYTKIVEYQSKEAISEEKLSHIKDLLASLDKMPNNGKKIIQRNVLKAYLTSTSLNTEAWRPIPPDKYWALSIERLKAIMRLGDIAEIGNGMVSGLDEAFKLGFEELSNLTDKERQAIIYVYKANTLGKFFPISQPIPYIFVNHVTSEENLKNDYPYFFNKLGRYKERLQTVSYTHLTLPTN